MGGERSGQGLHVRIVGKAKPFHQHAGVMRWNLARFLVALILVVFPCLGVSVTDRMLTKTVDTSTGCSAPTPATAFLTTDQRVWVWFNVTGANAGDIASATWYYPNGTAYKSANWNPVASSGSWCFPWSMDIAGNAPASSPGNWSVRVSWNGSLLFTLNFTIAASAPAISAGGILNAASYAVGTPVAPGSIVAVYGSFPLSTPAMTPGAPWPTTLGGLSMQFAGGTKAPLYYVSSGQVNLLVPWELANQSQASLTATVNGQTSTAQTVSLAAFSPGIFSMNGQGTGQGAILDTSYKLVDQSNPALAGTTYVQIYCTGLGPVANQPASGGISPSGPLATTPTMPVVTIGGLPAQVIFSGLAPGFVGEYQVNALVPAGVAPGDSVPLMISAGGRTSNTVTLAVRAGAGVVPQLTSVNPAAGTAGRVVTVLLTASNTGFLAGQTLASFGPGISVGGTPEGQAGVVTVLSPTTATAALTIDPAAALGPRAVTVATGSQTAAGTGMFTVTAAPSAMGPLQISSTLPANRATGVAVNQTIQVQFNEGLDPTTVGPSTFWLAAGQIPIPVKLSYDPARNTVSLVSTGSFSPQRTYTITVGAQVRSAAGSPLGTAATLSFTTVAAASVSGTMTVPSGVVPTNMTVIGFGGQTSTPTAAGQYTAAVNPTGVGLVAVMVPGKDFGLLATTLGGSAATVAAHTLEAPLVIREAVPETGARRVYRTRWQVTASSLAAAGVGLSHDYQTTAESLVFYTPELFTRNPNMVAAVMAEIAASPATAQLAAALGQSAGAADPMSDSSLAPALSNAVQAVVTSLAQKAKAPELSAVSLAANSSADSGTASRPSTVGVTPYCYPSFTASYPGLPCLDLRYLSFDTADAVTANQSPAGYGFTPQNCTGMFGGCALGWLGRLKPTSANPASVVPEAGTESPVGPGTYDSASCDSKNPCPTAWISGDSWFAYLDLPGLIMKGLQAGLASMGVSIDGAAFNLSENSGTSETYYIVRFYSGGAADAQENGYISAGSYSDGKRLALEAWSMNLIETAFNLISAVPGMDGPGATMDCVLQSADKSLILGAIAGSENNTLGGFLESCRTFASTLASDVAACTVSTDKKSPLIRMITKGLRLAAGAAAKVAAVVQIASTVANLGQATQRAWEMSNRASAVETAMIVIRPGPAATGNPVPSISLLSPSSVPSGTASQVVTISGLNFIPASTVAVNNAKRPATLMAGGQLQVTLNSSDLASTVPLEISVTNPPPGGGTYRATFLVSGAVLQAPAPQITSLLPSAAAAGGSSMSLTVQGSGFQTGATVKFNGVVHQTIPPSDGGQLTILLAVADLQKVAKVPVIASNPGVNNDSTALIFTVYDGNSALPAVDEVWTSQRTYLTGSSFGMNYRSIAGTAGGRYDLMISITAVTTGNVYYYYDDATDSNSRWLHSSVRPAWTGVPESRIYTIPSGGGAVFQVTDDIPSGKYHVKVYYSQPGANQMMNVAAETDFSLQTSTAPGGCFIATAAFGSPLARQVHVLRSFRDRILLSARAGRVFVKWYYVWSPRAAEWLQVHSLARKLTRAILWIPVAFSWSSLRTNVACASLGFLVLLLSLGWSLRRGPAWWKGLCTLILAIGIASAQEPHYKLSLQATATAASSSFSAAAREERPPHRPEPRFAPEGHAACVSRRMPPVLSHLLRIRGRNNKCCYVR